jgi:hypothetical protein
MDINLFKGKTTFCACMGHVAGAPLAEGVFHFCEGPGNQDGVL